MCFYKQRMYVRLWKIDIQYDNNLFFLCFSLKMKCANKKIELMLDFCENIFMNHLEEYTRETIWVWNS